MSLRTVLVGSGRLAQSLRAHFDGRVDVSTLEDIEGTYTALIHAGSGEHLTDAMDWCASSGTPFIQASSGLEWRLPETLTFPLIEATNLALPVAVLLEQLPTLAAALKGVGMTATLMESHQPAKKTVPATAQKMADVVGLSHEIRSLRHPPEQVARGVPESWVRRHGYHWLTFRGNLGISLEINVKVNGDGPYVDGAQQLLERLNGRTLEHRRYTIAEILEL